VDAATLAMCPIALNGMQSLIGDVEEATQVIVLDRILVPRDEFWLIFDWIQETANTLELLLVRSRSTRTGIVATHCVIPSDSLVTHTNS
jgi:hypothetical protein